MAFNVRPVQWMASAAATKDVGMVTTEMNT